VTYPDVDGLLCASRADDTCAHQRAVRRRRLTGSPQNRDMSRRGEGLPGYWAILFARARVEHPAGYPPLLALQTQGSVVAFAFVQDARHPGKLGFGAAFLWPARSHAYASPPSFRRPSQGLLPAQAGSPLAERDLHPLDDRQNFMKASHPSIPFDQHCLVALDALALTVQDLARSGYRLIAEAFKYQCLCLEILQLP
jgi:hypothetical protein